METTGSGTGTRYTNSFKASVTASRAAEAAVAWGTLDDCFAACELPQQHQFGTLCEANFEKNSHPRSLTNSQRLGSFSYFYGALHRNDHVTEMGYI